MRVLLDSDPFCPKCGHNRDTSSVSTIIDADRHICQMCGAEWLEEVELSTVEIPTSGTITITDLPDKP